MQAQEKLPALPEGSISELHHVCEQSRDCDMPGKLSHHTSTVDLHWRVFWSIQCLSKYDAKGKPRLSKMILFPGGNRSRKKRDALRNPIGFGAGAPLVYILLQTPSLQRIFVSYAAFAKSKVMVKIK